MSVSICSCMSLCFHIQKLQLNDCIYYCTLCYKEVSSNHVCSVSVLLTVKNWWMILMFNQKEHKMQLKEFRCYEVKIDEAGSQQDSNTGHLWLEPLVLCHWATEARQSPTLTILYMYCAGGTECLSRTPGSHSVCAIRTPVRGQPYNSLHQEKPMLSGFLTLNAQSR